MAPEGLGEEGQQPLALHISDSGEWRCHVTVSGELDLNSAPVLREALEDAVGRGRNRVSIDAAGVTFIDSSALMVVLTARNDLVAGGGTLYLTDASPPVTRILEIAMLTDLVIDRSGDESSEEEPPPVD
jgi:anti-sigma B factor antagonist